MCTSQSQLLATHHRTCATQESALSELDEFALELVELVQAKTGLGAEAECVGQCIRVRTVGGRAFGTLPAWNFRALERADPTRLEIRWDLSRGPEGVFLRAEFWLLPEGKKPDAVHR